MRMALHVARGLMTAAIRFPRLDEPRRMLEVRRWSARLLAILSVRIETHGNPPRPGEPAMIVPDDPILETGDPTPPTAPVLLDLIAI